MTSKEQFTILELCKVLKDANDELEKLQKDLKPYLTEEHKKAFDAISYTQGIVAGFMRGLAIATPKNVKTEFVDNRKELDMARIKENLQEGDE